MNQNSNGTSLVLRVAEENNFTRTQVELLRNTAAKDCSDQEVAQLLIAAARTGLDPFARQIYMVRRKQRGQWIGTLQTGIDGYRAIADRTGQYAGADDYRFDEGLTEYQHIMSERGNPITATATVYKMVAGQRCPFTATVRWEEYYPGDPVGFMWKKMPYLMLGKCAEALALRKAFPANLSGLYTAEEMAQAGEPEITVAHDDAIEGEYREEQPAIEPPGLPDLYHAAKQRGLTKEDARKLWKEAGFTGYKAERHDAMLQALDDALLQEPVVME